MFNITTIYIVCLLYAADVIVNMCTTATTYFNESLHVTINESVTNYQACECHLNNANFSVVINDLRLTSNVDEAICSPAEFMINSDRTFVCSQDSDHFNSVFHSKVIGSSANAFMAIKPNSRHVIPAMVLLTVNPEARARIECLGRKRRSDSANTAVTSADASPYTLSRTVVRTDVVTQSSTTAIQQRTSTPNPLTTASTSHATEPHATPGQRQDTDSLGTSLPSLIKDVAVIKTAVLSSLFLFAMTIVLTAWYFYQHPRKWNELKSHFSCWRNSRSSDVDYHQESHEASSDKSPNKTTNDKQSDDHHDEQDKLLDTSSILKISVEQPDDSRGEFVSLKSIKGKKRYNREELSTEADSLLETEGKRSYSIGSREPMPSNSNSSLTSPGDSSGISDINDIPDPALSPNSENKQK